MVVGSSLIGQTFTSPQYFHPRPSAAGDGLRRPARRADPTSARPTPTSSTTVAERVAAYRDENGLGADVLVPVDAVTASGSGLDPHISVRNARPPGAAGRRGARDLDVDEVMQASSTITSTTGRSAILGDPGVNVLELNLALDDVAPIDAAERERLSVGRQE